MKSFFFFSIRRMSRSYCVQPGQDDRCGSANQNQCNRIDFSKGAWPRWRRHLAGGPKMLHNQPRLDTFQTPDEINNLTVANKSASLHTTFIKSSESKQSLSKLLSFYLI